MKKLKYLLLIPFFLGINSCESTDLDGTDNVNALPPTSGDPSFILNYVQTEFASFYYDMSQDSRPVVRMVNQFGSYAGVADPQDTQDQWTTAYTSILKNTKTLREVHATTPIPYHLGIAKILEAYTMVTMVDFYGDVPYSETLFGSANLLPRVDSGVSIYDKMIVSLDEAITLLNTTGVLNTPTTDLYYGGDNSKWIKLANSLKLKMYNNLRLTRDVSTQVNAIVASGKIFTSNADDFNFKYSTTATGSDSRHPDYIAEYDGSPSFYLSNSYMKLLFADKTVIDPRRRYYFYRQTSAAPSGTNLPCSGNTNIPICYLGSGTWGGGYWGRDHADNTGIPADGVRRAVVGLYPAGGRYDNNNYTQAAPDPLKPQLEANNAKGAGILNILDYSFVQFMLAELALTESGVSGTPLTYLNNGVNANITKVMTFRPDLQLGNIPTAANVTSYKNEVTSKYNAAATPTDKLNVIEKEFFIAAWGNGMEAYNMYRRTGLPAHNPANIAIQSPVTAAGTFVRSYFYPTNAVNNNVNITQHSLSTKVFWDNNPDNFVD